jgi:hypothetical protein
LNAPYKDVTVVYGVLNYQDSIHYVKIYKGFQSQGGDVFINAQNPDSIYYPTDQIQVELQEFANGKRTSRAPIPLFMTHEFPRDTGIFYYDKEKIIYYTTEEINPDCSYRIVITNKLTKKVIEGETLIVGYFRMDLTTSAFDIRSTLSKTGTISFTAAPNALSYEIHVNFLYFEVDIHTKEILKIGKVKKNITPHIDEVFEYYELENQYKKKYTKTFYTDIAAQLKPDDGIIRYAGTPDKPGVCIEIEGWAAEENLVKFLQSAKPTSSFVQVNNRYTNMTVSDGLAFGFFSSRFKCPTRYYGITEESQDSLIKGSDTNLLGFRPWIEYKP